MEDDAIELISENEGMDDDRQSVFRHTYIIGSGRFSVKKEVRFTRENNFFKRNEFIFER